MYNLTLTNNFVTVITVEAGGSHPVGIGASFDVPGNLGNAFLTVPGIGQMLLVDVAEQQIGGWSKATWGVFLAYQGEEVAFRYEGQGKLHITIDQFGRANMSGNGAFSYVTLGAFVLPQQ